MNVDHYQRAAQYAGAAPGANGNTTTLFDSTTSKLEPSARRALVALLNSHAGTLIAQVSNERGADGTVTWRAAYSEAIGANTVMTWRPVRFDGFKHVRIQWTNGGSAQSPFVVAFAFDDGMAELASLPGGVATSVDDGGGSLTVDSAQLPATLGQKTPALSLAVVEALSIVLNTTYIVSGDMSADILGPAITVGPAGRVRFDVAWASTGTAIGTLMLQALGADGSTWTNLEESVAAFSQHPNNTTAAITAHFRELQIFAQVRLKYVRTSGGTANTSFNVDTSVA